jgi:hypothetical protein
LLTLCALVPATLSFRRSGHRDPLPPAEPA